MSVIDIQKEIYDTVQKKKMLRNKLDDKIDELETIIEKLDDSTNSFFEIKTDTIFTDHFIVSLYDVNIDIEKLINKFNDEYLIKLYVNTQAEEYAKLIFYKKKD